MQIFLKLAYAFSPAGYLASAFIFCCIFLPASLTAQEPPRPEIDINTFIQTLLPIPTEDADYTDVYEALFQLYTNPLDLNQATRDELSAVFVLSEIQLNAFIDYREKSGALLSLYELQAIPGFDLTTIGKLLPFVTVEPRQITLRESFKNPTQHFLLLRSAKLLEQQKGYSSLDSASRSATRYAGKPWNGYARYRHARAGVYSLGFTFEKDGGEVFWDWKPKNQIFGIDFTSFHAQIMNRGRLKNLIIGDFQMQAGQGLVMAAGFSLGKGSEVIRTTYRSTLGLKPYTSVLEANFFRGIAATFAFHRQLEMTAFYSLTRRDASLDNTADDPDALVVSSLLVSGYHRTAAERAKHGIIPEQNTGLHLIYKIPSNAGQFGLTILNTHYGTSLLKKDVPYNRFEFTGSSNLVIGLHGDYRWQNFHFFGEAARSQSGGTGAIGGWIAGLGKTLDFTMLFRRYDKNFHSLYGNALAEATRPINETGMYWGLRYMPNRKWQFSGFYDYFRFPWLKYQVNAPSDGHDIFLHSLWKPSKKLNAYLLFHEKHKQRNAPESDANVIPVVNSVRRTIMFNLEYEIPLKYAIRTRVQYGDLRYEGGSRSAGFTVVQDVTRHFPKFEISARIAFFKTDNYDSRQYVYEKDMLYAFSIPAYYDTGTRHYLILKYNLSKKMKVWVRWSQTRYSNLEKISSGLSEIQGDTRSEVKMQMMYQF